MPRKTKYQQRGVMAARSRMANAPIVLNSLQFALAVLTEGFTFEGSQRFALKTNTIPPERTEFNAILHRIGPTIEQLAKKSCNEALDEAYGPIAHDGSYSCKRNAPHCSFDIISLKTGKIIYYVIASKDPKVSMITIPPKKSSNFLEKACCDVAAHFIKAYPKFTARVHDLDLLSFASFHEKDEEASTIQDFFDGGHMKKIIMRLFDDFNTAKPLGRIKGRIVERFSFCIGCNKTCDEKTRLWLETQKYFENNTKENNIWKEGIKIQQKFIDSQTLKSNLEEFLKETQWCVQKAGLGRSNVCEAFHGLKSRIIRKDTKSGYIFRVRIAICVLMWNDPTTYYTQICEALNVPPIDSSLNARLQAKIERRAIENLKTHSPESHKRRAMARKEKKIKNAPVSREGHTDQKHPEVEQYQTKKDVRRTKPSLMLGGLMTIECNDYLNVIINLLFNTKLFFFVKRICNESTPVCMVMKEIFTKLELREIVIEPLKKLISLLEFPTKYRLHPKNAYIKIMRQILHETQNDPEFISEFCYKVKTVDKCIHCSAIKASIKIMFLLDLSNNPADTLQDSLAKWETCSINNECQACNEITAHNITNTIISSPQNPVVVIDPKAQIDIMSINILQKYYSPYFFVKFYKENSSSSLKYEIDDIAALSIPEEAHMYYHAFLKQLNEIEVTHYHNERTYRSQYETFTHNFVELIALEEDQVTTKLLNGHAQEQSTRYPKKIIIKNHVQFNK